MDAEWGIDFVHHHGGSGRYYMVEANGGGVVLFDYDDDGDLDIFLADGAPLPGYTGKTPRSRLWRNDGLRHDESGEHSGRTFVDVTDRSGIDLDVYASGGAAGDIDGDGDLDLYVTAFGSNRLFLNNGVGGFKESAAAAGIDDSSWSASAAFGDVDRDGDLDLYVANYVDFTLDNNKPCGDEKRSLRGYCGPDVYQPLGDRFYRNRGDGTFVDATAAAGLGQASGAGLAVSFADLDDDGWLDLYVANDLTPNFLFRNRGDGTFEDRSLLSGTAYGPRGQAEAGMGVALADLDGDLRFDIVVTNYEGETNGLYRQRDGFLFRDQRFLSGLAEPTLRKLAFGTAAADFDQDGWLDLVFANGHVRENAALFSRLSVYRQPNQLFLGSGDGRFREKQAGLAAVAPSRGLAYGDLDNDGDLDLVITNVGERVEVYENLGSGGDLAHGFIVDGRGLGIGDRWTLTADGHKQVREIGAGASFMSQHAAVAHFGLAGASRVDRLTLRSADGRRVTLLNLPADRRMIWVKRVAPERSSAVMIR